MLTYSHKLSMVTKTMDTTVACLLLRVKHVYRKMVSVVLLLLLNEHSQLRWPTEVFWAYDKDAS